MVETIVWATDGSALADAALHEARRLAPRRIIVVHCTHRHKRVHGKEPAEPERSAWIDAVVEHLREEGLDVRIVTRLGHDSETIAAAVAEVATELHADLVVCGTRGRGSVSGALHWSVASRLLHLVHCPVLVVPPHVEAHADEAVLAGA